MIGGKRRSWLQLYVDAMTEKDPYKRLALVRELGKTRKKAKRTEVARVDDLKDAPQVGQPVLDRCAGHGHAPVSANCLRRPGCAGRGVLDILRFVALTHQR